MKVEFPSITAHTPDNTFLGFVMGMNDTGTAPLLKENIAVVYGKVLNLWKVCKMFVYNL